MEHFMGYRKRLDKSFESAPVLPLCPNSHYVLFSDCHRGNGTHNDNFLKNQHLYFAALKYYYRQGFTYIELGDGDELWENRHIEQIKEIHGNVFWQLSLFERKKRLYMIYGNHDMVKQNLCYCRENYSTYFCTSTQQMEPLFTNIKFHAGIILRTTGSGSDIYLTHGHQASLLNSSLWKLGRFLVRYLWKPLEQIGVLDPTSAAKNYSIKDRTEQKLSTWAQENRHILITGHTHRPMLPPTPALYLNTGSCIHPRCITCIELTGREAVLVKWHMGTREDGAFYLERTVLARRTL